MTEYERMFVSLGPAIPPGEAQALHRHARVGAPALDRESALVRELQGLEQQIRSCATG